MLIGGLNAALDGSLPGGSLGELDDADVALDVALAEGGMDGDWPLLAGPQTAQNVPSACSPIEVP